MVSDVAGSALPVARAGEGQHLVTLVSVEDDALGEELQVVWEIEPGARNSIESGAGYLGRTASTRPSPSPGIPARRSVGCGHRRRHQSLQSPFRSGITIEDYQLDPVVRAMQSPASTS